MLDGVHGIELYAAVDQLQTMLNALQKYACYWVESDHVWFTGCHMMAAASHPGNFDTRDLTACALAKISWGVWIGRGATSRQRAQKTVLESNYLKN